MTRVLMALVDAGEFKIVDSKDDASLPLRPSLSRKEAEAIYKLAKAERPEVNWKIIGRGKGPFGVHEAPAAFKR